MKGHLIMLAAALLLVSGENTLFAYYLTSIGEVTNIISLLPYFHWGSDKHYYYLITLLPLGK